MTNDQTIVIAAATLMGKDMPTSRTDGHGVTRNFEIKIQTPEQALEIARQMMVAQTNHSRQMLVNATMPVDQRTALNG